MRMGLPIYIDSRGSQPDFIMFCINEGLNIFNIEKCIDNKTYKITLDKSSLCVYEMNYQIQYYDWIKEKTTDFIKSFVSNDGGPMKNHDDFVKSVIDKDFKCSIPLMSKEEWDELQRFHPEISDEEWHTMDLV